MKFSCAECDNLNKNKKEWNATKYCYRYGCNARKEDGYISFWCLADNDLNTGGCSDFKHEEVEQLTMF